MKQRLVRLLILSLALLATACGGKAISEPIGDAETPVTVQCGQDTLVEARCGAGIGGHSWAVRIPHPAGQSGFIWSDVRFARCVPGLVEFTYRTDPVPSTQYSIQDDVWDCGSEQKFWYSDITNLAPIVSIVSYQCATVVTTNPFIIEGDHIDVASTQYQTGIGADHSSLGWRKWSMVGSQLCVALQPQFPRSNPSTFTHLWGHGSQIAWSVQVKDAAHDHLSSVTCSCSGDRGIPGNPNTATSF